MRKESLPVPSLAGSLLLAHPSLQDPNFVRSVILISAHSNDDGAIGVTINRPTGQTLSELNPDFTDSPLGDIPVYRGGPVSSDQLILTGWKWMSDESMFKLYFGLTPEKALEIIHDDDVELRGFLGYSGWAEGQIEEEINQNAWVVSPLQGSFMDAADGDGLWRSLLVAAAPEWGVLLDEPDDPSQN